MRIYPLQNPFLALRSFELKDARRFFGRDADLVLVQGRLLSGRTTLLFAASGVGKTSFLNARLTPALQETTFIVSHRDWATDAPLDSLRKSIVKSAGDAATQAQATLPDGFADRPAFEQLEIVATQDADRPILLILDQFEEVFLHWRETTALDDFAREIGRLVHARTMDVRVLLSMREEFLGELSVFDNLIPDLFNNSYRLKNPARADAEEIIRRTAATAQDVECGAGLEPLLDDLIATTRGSQHSAARGALSRSGRVSMPFLQIVCHRLWARQFGPRPAVLPRIDAKFLDAPSANLASAELEAYCREKLEALNLDARDLASAAFGFLMTPAGSKMAYPIDVLASQAKVDEGALEGVLLQLCHPDVRILREIPVAGGGKPWFELYHDLYARFLSEWKQRHDREREIERRQRLEREQQATVDEKVREATADKERKLRRYDRISKIAPIVLVVAGALFSTASDYWGKYRPLRRFTHAASIAPESGAYLAARTQYDGLQNSVGLIARSRETWAHYWRQRAQLEMLSGQSDRAILSLLRSMNVSPDAGAARQLSGWLQPFALPVRTYRTPEAFERFGYLSDPDRIYAALPGCRVLFWDRATGKSLPSWSPPPALSGCVRLNTFSRDGAFAVVESFDRAMVVELSSGKLGWESRRTVNSPFRASFRRDGRSALVNFDNELCVISMEGPASACRRVPASARYRYSPFSDSVFVSGGAEAPRFETEVGRVLTTVPAVADLGEEGTAFSYAPLPGDSVATVSSERIVLPAAGSAPRVIPLSLSSGWVVTDDGKSLVFANADGRLTQVAVETGEVESFALTPSETGRTSTLVASNRGILLGTRDQQVVREMLFPSRRLEPKRIVRDGIVAGWSRDGRWMLISGTDCRIVELVKGDARQLSPTPCEGDRFVFSPGGARLLDSADTLPAGQPVRVIDPVTLRATVLDVPDRNAIWASDHYLIVSAPGGSSLLNLTTGQREPVDAPKGVFPVDPRRMESLCVGDRPASHVRLSPDEQHAVVFEGGGLALYDRREGRWTNRRAAPGARNAANLAFDAGGARFLTLLGGNTVGVRQPEDGDLVASLNADLTPLCAVGFGPGASVNAVTERRMPDDDPELVLWRAASTFFGSGEYDATVWRSPIAGSPVFGPSSPTSTVLFVARSLAWLSIDGSEPVLQVRPLPGYGDVRRGLAPAFRADPGLDAIRVVSGFADGRIMSATFRSDFADFPAYTPAAGFTWEQTYLAWAKRFDLQLDEASGAYTSLSSAPGAPETVAPSGVRPEDRAVSYEVAADRDVSFTVQPAFGQAAQARLIGARADRVVPVSGAPFVLGRDLVGQKLTLTIVVTDVNAATNRVGATLRISGGPTESMTNLETEVSDGGTARFDVRLSFVAAAPAVLPPRPPTN